MLNIIGTISIKHKSSLGYVCCRVGAVICRRYLFARLSRLRMDGKAVIYWPDDVQLVCLSRIYSLCLCLWMTYGCGRLTLLYLITRCSICKYYCYFIIWIEYHISVLGKYQFRRATRTTTTRDKACVVNQTTCVRKDIYGPSVAGLTQSRRSSESSLSERGHRIMFTHLKGNRYWI